MLKKIVGKRLLRNILSQNVSDLSEQKVFAILILISPEEYPIEFIIHVFGKAKKNPIYTNLLGFMYMRGLEVTKNVAKAAKLFNIAADQGNAMAQCCLGEMYCRGRDVPKDVAEAARLYKLSADQGHAQAQFCLGEMYCYYDRGVPKDDAEALRLCKLAADQGHPEAQVYLGHMYNQDYRGFGVPKDDAEALRLYKLATDQGHAEARTFLTHLLLHHMSISPCQSVT